MCQWVLSLMDFIIWCIETSHGWGMSYYLGWKPRNGTSIGQLLTALFLSHKLNGGKTFELSIFRSESNNTQKGQIELWQLLTVVGDLLCIIWLGFENT